MPASISYSKIFLKLTSALLVLLFLSITPTTPLHISNMAPVPRSSSSDNCKETLTKRLECPSIGSFPVAGSCDYFVRCIQTENGVESEATFCPEGQAFMVNRCVTTVNPDDCPQKECPQEMVTQPPKTTPRTTRRPYFPELQTNKPVLQNLHPSKNQGVGKHHADIQKLNLFLLVATNTVFYSYL